MTASIKIFMKNYGNALEEDIKGEPRLEMLVPTVRSIREDMGIEGSEKLTSCADSILEVTQKSLESGWTHVCERELHVLGLLCRSLGHLNAGDPFQSIKNLDLSVIFGAPKDCTAPLVSVLVPMCNERVEKSDRKLEVFPHAFEGPSPLEQLSSASPIEVVDNCSPSDFKKKYYSKERPVVVLYDEGVASWAAMSKWKDLQNIINTVGYRTVPIEVGCKRRGEWKEETSTIEDFINNKILSPDGVPAYLAQHELLEHLPELAEDVSTPNVLKDVDSDSIIRNCWIGTAETITELHKDSYDNFFVQVAGFKYIRLYAPKHARHLKISKSSGHAAQGNCSTLRCEDPSSADHLADIPYQEVLLPPGAALFIPEGWFHYLRAVTPSISVNHWF
eukprot:TRINITY_DN16539_c0_g1_i1.p1 TRINITY_DN16539_c0_g1~~TRINITY_DN16539_c0_g1_i1.p1  ORF type:complete len:409 (+),score=99.05 TRINITY_DN16539_c0_g1_i1:59-1228(+)